MQQLLLIGIQKGSLACFSYCLESPTVSTLTATEEEMPTDGEYSTAKYLSGVVINVIFSRSNNC